MIYDVIGDVHGQADKLIGLLTQLGYQHDGQCFQAPANHQAIFIGDLIDRGSQQLQTLSIVFAMIDHGQALAVMGNHEYNALAYATPDARNVSQYLRQHDDRHTSQHQAFLDEVGFGSELHQFWLKRFYELPLWLALDDACFVHACWDSDAMAILKPLLTTDNRLTPLALQKTSEEGTPAFEALERVLKGVEAPLPEGILLVDKEGHQRKNVRVQWWQPNLSFQPIHQIARASQEDLIHIPKDTLTAEILFGLDHDKPIFVGHYWLNGTPELLSHQVVCVDYSAAKDGFLTAYQFDTDHPALTSANFIQYQH